VKTQSPVEECWVAGMASKDDAAECTCFRPGTSATRHTSDDKYPGPGSSIAQDCIGLSKV